VALAVGRFLRDHAFLVAATALPLVVVGFFLLATAIPRFTVPPPAYDLLFHTTAFDQAAPRMNVDLTVRDGQLFATLRPASDTSYPSRVHLWHFDHRTLTVREVPLDLPDRLAEDDGPQTIPVGAFAGRRVLAQPQAPDGYDLRSPTHRGPGIIGELFGMHRSDRTLSIAHRGRVIAIELPSPHAYQSPTMLGWLND
jgi:hypothetical protein